MEHNPVIPSELTYIANVSRVPSHDGLWDLPVGHINVVGRARTYECLQLNAVIPESFGSSGLYHFSGHSPF